MPTALDNGQRSPRKLLRAVIAALDNGQRSRTLLRAVVARLLGRKP